MGIVWDGTINPGSVLNAVVLLVGFVVAFTRIGGRLDLLSLRVQGIEKALTNTEGIDKRLATLEERVTNHVAMMVQFQKDIAASREQWHEDLSEIRNLVAELRRGEGWITARRKTVDGEY